MAMSTLTKVMSNFVCHKETSSKIHKTSAVKYLRHKRNLGAFSLYKWKKDF